MSFGLKKGQKKPNQEGGKIQGPGTGTSDDVQKTVPSGSYIMPKDSTDAIGEENLERLGKPTDVNLSNGEFQLTPDQVHQVGVQALDQMKGQTHTQINQPTVGFGIGKGGQKNKPELFFANGGLVTSPYPNADEVRKAQQARLGGPQMRDVTPEQRQLPATRTPQPQSITPNTAAPSSSSGSGFGLKAANMAKGLGKFHVVGAGLGGAAAGLNTSTEDYATRMGLDRNAERGPLAEAAIRTTGVLTDVGNAASFGLLGNRFADKQMNQAQADVDANIADIARRRAERDATRAKTTPQQQTAAALPATSFNDQMNDAMYGSNESRPAQPSANNPYAIQQKGNSFSYANPNAANQAREAGIPELQSSGFAGGIRPANDARGVAKFMANTREMGPSEQQIQAAVGQQMNPQGFGLRYPERPVRTAEQEAQLQAEIARVSAPIAGSKGLTASQRNQINDLQMGYANRDVQMYNTDANNATSQLNNATNNTSAIAQTMMREQGSNDRAVLGENGQNSRYGMGLEQDAAKFNAEFGLKKREAKLNETKEGFGIRNSQRVEKLYEMYDKAETDEQRATIQERINRFTGAKGESGKDRYMTVGGGQEYNKEEGVMINRPQQIFDTKTGQLQNIDGNSSRQAAPGANSDKFKGYQVYTDANGSSAYFDPETGQFRPIPK